MVRGMKANEFMCLPVSEALNPTSGHYFQRIANAWWIVHPERGLVFFNPQRRRTGSLYGSAQCNVNEKVIRKLSSDGTYRFPHEIRFFEVVWVPVNPRER